MDIFIWKVNVADGVNTHAVMNSYNVTASTMQEAVEKALVLEQLFVAEVNLGAEGCERITACVPVSVNLVCELHS